MYNQEINNPYLYTEWLNSQFSEAMKARERTAVHAILAAQEQKISNERTNQTQKLTQSSSDMTEFASKTLVSGLEEGLTGKAADAASHHLTTSLKKADFNSPIKKT